jgi:hypothetical protein
VTVGYYWLAWLALGFGIPEGIALATGHPGNTLSDTVWHWCDVTPGSTLGHWTFLHIVLAALMFWLSGHFVLGIWRG